MASKKQGRGEPDTSAHRVEATLKQAEAIKLRTKGLSLDEIADALGYAGKQGAHKAIVSGLRKVLREPAEELRTLESERLDRALEACWPKVTSGELPAIDRFLRIQERRAKLLGLDSPTKIDLTPLVKELAEAEGLDAGELLAEVARLQNEVEG